MADEHAACVGDDMFTADRPDVPNIELVRMRGVCAACPVFAECATYARAARPKAGFWAGAHRDRLSK